MLKIPKGLKKKKKGKKKKDQELFTEEELEQYKQEQARKAEEAAVVQSTVIAAASSAEENVEKPSSNDEEWSKFAKLTSGVDSIVKRTQDDLDRIKTTSFFQRVAPKIETDEVVEPEEDEETKKARELEALKSAVVELSESEYETDDDTSVFDTEFTSTGELPLAYIPDSPEFEQVGGDDDIFDTAYADKVITGPQVSQKSGKKIVSIGSEVLQVLTGAVDNIPKSTVTKRPKRRGIQNLMLSSFDKDNEDVQDIVQETSQPMHDVLDSLLELPPDEIENVEIDLSVSMHVKFIENNPEEKQDEIIVESNNNDDVLKEFDVLNDEEDDEFGQLAAESLTKPTENIIKITEIIPLVPKNPPQETSEWAGFEKSGVEEEEEEEVLDDDPFNTEFAESVLPRVDSFEELAKESLSSKRSESIKPLPEVNIQQSLMDDDNPVIEVTEANETIRRDELARRKSSLSLSINSSKVVQFAVPTPDPMKSDIEFSALIKKPLTPYYAQDDEPEEAEDVDPFDTSFVPNAGPTKLELNYIEKDLLNTTLKDLEDDDFDPRAVTPIPVETVTAAATAVNENVIKEESDPFGNAAMFEEDKYLALASMDGATKEVNGPTDSMDILSNTLNVGDVDTKVLTPQINASDSFEIADIDPFDTTFAENLRPGQAEIKVIESELIS